MVVFNPVEVVFFIAFKGCVDEGFPVAIADGFVTADGFASTADTLAVDLFIFSEAIGDRKTDFTKIFCELLPSTAPLSCEGVS